MASYDKKWMNKDKNKNQREKKIKKTTGKKREDKIKNELRNFALGNEDTKEDFFYGED